MEIRDLGPSDIDAVVAASDLFDDPAVERFAQRFLDSEGHPLLVAYEDTGPVGFVSGVEMTHPDKGTEMFLYELGVDEPARRRGTGTALVEALGELARERGCHGMWTATEAGNLVAQRTYAAAGSTAVAAHLFGGWRWRQAPVRSRSSGRSRPDGPVARLPHRTAPWPT